MGLAAHDTAELSFVDVSVPQQNLLGKEGHGLMHLMERLPKERLSIAMAAISATRAAYEWTRDYAFSRAAFKSRVGDFQHTRFTLAEMLTEITLTQTYRDQAVLAHNAGELTEIDAAQAKWWATELQKRVVDSCLQLHGGYGYMMEYPIARSFVDGRIQTIYGGTTEIMKEIIGRAIANGLA